jgi:hypothetical protein
MDQLEGTWSQKCACSRTFSIPSAYTYHRRTCLPSKKRLAVNLEKARELEAATKRRRITDSESNLPVKAQAAYSKSVPVVMSSESTSMSPTVPGNSDLQAAGPSESVVRLHPTLIVFTT